MLITDYNEKMETLLSDHQTYQLVPKPPFAKIERELNLNKKGKIDDSTYYKLRSTDAIPPAIQDKTHVTRLSTMKLNIYMRLLFLPERMSFFSVRLQCTTRSKCDVFICTTSTSRSEHRQTLII